MFYTLPRPLLTRDAYQALWDSWRREEGFEVLSCISSNAFVSLQGDVAVFVHDVATELRMQGEQFLARNARPSSSRDRDLAHKNNKACGWPVMNIYPLCRKGCRPLSQCDRN